MTLIQSVILGIVEGITEFLPISSTAHLDIVSRLLQITSTDYVKTFHIAIQLGAILAVILLYGKTLTRSRHVWKKVLVAFIPTAVIGFVFYKIIKNYFLGNYALMLWALALGGIAIIIFEIVHTEKLTINTPVQEIEAMPYTTAFLIGCAQALSVVPGVSRAAATIISGLALGLRRQAIVEFSFMLAIPTMVAATGYDLAKSAGAFSWSEINVLLIGFAAAFVSAILAIQVLIQFIKRENFIVFGIYRIILALALFIFFT